jgi:hypothetical protein
LDLILLLRAVASSDNEEDGYSVRQAAGVWRRALAQCGHQISIPAVSKAWTRLEKRKPHPMVKWAWATACSA